DFSTLLAARDTSGPAAPNAVGAAPDGITVDLVWPTAGASSDLDRTEMFNLIAANREEDIPPFILAKEFEHRVTHSADRITSTYGLALDPSPLMTGQFDPDPDHTKPIVAHFANFNKLRVDLVSDGRALLALNSPDALVPVDLAS